MLLVLVEPLVAVLHEQLVLTEGGVHEAVDERRGQVLAGGIHLTAAECRTRVVFQVRLVNVLWRFWLHDVQLQKHWSHHKYRLSSESSGYLAGKRQKVVVQLSVGHDFDQVVVVFKFFIELQKHLLSAEHEGQLLSHCAVTKYSYTIVVFDWKLLLLPVFAGQKYFFYQCVVIDLQSETKSLWPLVELSIDRKGSLEEVNVLWVGNVRHAVA